MSQLHGSLGEEILGCGKSRCKDPEAVCLSNCGRPGRLARGGKREDYLAGIRSETGRGHVGFLNY